MKLTFIGKTNRDGGDSQGGNCPSLYETDDGHIVVQGTKLANTEAVGQLRDVSSDEGAVVVPPELIKRFASGL